MNVGTVDRVVRLTVAALLFAVFFYVPGPLHWLGLVGIVPLVTALIGWCPIYTLFGISTCAVKDDYV